MNESILVNSFSLTSYYIEIFFDEQILSNATCFFIRRNGKLFLVTNWHVVSGRNADTKECLNSQGAIPNKLKIYLPQKMENGDFAIELNRYCEIPLCDSEDNRLWFELEKNGRMVDIALIPIKEEEINGDYLPVEEAEEPFNEDTKVEIAEDVFIIGFPFGRIGGIVPIWKRGSVASEPMLDMEDMPFFYVDTATKEGMSGSPVIYYKSRPMTLLGEGKMSRYFTKFVGVYSGRLKTSAGNDPQLGRVWKASVIAEIIEKGNCEEDNHEIL